MKLNEARCNFPLKIVICFHLTFKRRNKTSYLPSLVVWNQSLERPGNVPVDKYSAHLIRGEGWERASWRERWMRKKEGNE